MNLVEHVKECIRKTNLKESKITNDILYLQGLCGEGNRHFYNNLVNMDDARYLEIGTWKGASLCAAMCNNKATVIGIDDFCAQEAKKEFYPNFEKFKGENNARFIEQDCFKVDVKTLPKINIYMYDGDHRFQCHHTALVHFYEALDDIFIYVVDDWDWELPRNETLRAIEDLKFKVLFREEVITNNIADPRHYNGGCDNRFWGNGTGIFVLEKTKL